MLHTMFEDHNIEYLCMLHTMAWFGTLNAKLDVCTLVKNITD